MVNEKKETEKKVVTEIINGNLVLVRDIIKDKSGKQLKSQEGRELYSYIVKGKVRGRDIKVDFSPKDVGGYEPLDIVFDVSDKAELLISVEEMTDQTSGKKSEYTSYSAQAIDELGMAWKCGIKPQRNSDKDLLLMLLNAMKVVNI